PGRPGDLLHLHARFLQKRLRVLNRACNPLRKLRTCSALCLFVHFCRLRRHTSLSYSRESPLAPLQFLAGEEGFEPPYPVLETGVLTVGRLPLKQPSSRAAATLRRPRAPAPRLTSLPCARCASGTHCRTFSSPCARSAFSCSWSSCSCGF